MPVLSSFPLPRHKGLFTFYRDEPRVCTGPRENRMIRASRATLHFPNARVLVPLESAKSKAERERAAHSPGVGRERLYSCRRETVVRENGYAYM